MSRVYILNVIQKKFTKMYQSIAKHLNIICTKCHGDNVKQALNRDMVRQNIQIDTQLFHLRFLLAKLI